MGVLNNGNDLEMSYSSFSSPLNQGELGFIHMLRWNLAFIVAIRTLIALTLCFTSSALDQDSGDTSLLSANP